VTNTSGVITGFGSVFVNGVEYETDSAEVSTDDNDAASEADLQIGMVITLSGEVNDDGTTGSAAKIHYEEQIKGPLESLDLAASTMIVLGQNIIFDELTNLDNLVLEDLNLGDFLEISGFFDEDGNLYASRIEKEDNVETLKVQGIVSLLDTDAQTFQLTDLIINYSTAVFDDFTVDELVNDLAVKVKGDASALVDGVFTINKVELAEEEAEHNSGDSRHLEGIISNFESSASFVVNGVNIITDSETSYEHGTVDSLALHVRIKIKGTFDADGNLLAEEVRIHQRSQLKIAGLVQAIDLDLNTVTVLDVVFQVSDQTKMKDKSDGSVRFFDLADLLVNDFVEVRGFIGDNAVNIATKLDRKNSDDDTETELKGTVSNIVDFTFEVVEVTVHTDENTAFEDQHGDDVDQAQFFEQLADDMLVEVEGQLSEGVFTATKVEVEEGDDDDNDDSNRTELRGLIESIGDNSLVISGHTVNVASNTEFEVDDEDINAEQFWFLAQVGDQAKVKGTADEDGVITAKSVELEIEHQDEVAKAELKGEGTLIEGVLMVVGHQVEFDDSASFENLEEHISFDEFLVQAPLWEFFKVKGKLRDDVLFASKIEQIEEDDDDNVELSAFVEEVLENAIVIAGHKAVFNDDTQFLLREESITKEAFFSRVDTNNRVDLEGKFDTEEQSDGTSAEIIMTSSVSLQSNN